MSSLRRTPCVGICSTTYGDLVCRGCKRFSHEIVQWNGFDDEQQVLVWQRLRDLREGAVLSSAVIVDEQRLLESAKLLKVPDCAELTIANVAFEVLRRSRNETHFADLGLRSRLPDQTVSQLYQQIEGELYTRSLAQYERNFHVPAQ